MFEQEYITFDNYLLNELSAEALLDFERRLESDAAFKKRFDTYKEVSNFLENKFKNEAEAHAFKTNLEAISTHHFNATKAETETHKKRSRFRISQLALAASVVLFLGVFLFNQFSNPTYSDYNAHEPMTVVRGEDHVKELIEATKAFNAKDYKKANALLKTVLDTDSENSELLLYYAITNIELDNFEVADTTLKPLIARDSAYKNRALWYAALSQLKQNKTAESIVFLKQIPEGADDYKAAKKLLNKLD